MSEVITLNILFLQKDFIQTISNRIIDLYVRTLIVLLFLTIPLYFVLINLRVERSKLRQINNFSYILTAVFLDNVNIVS